MKKKLAGSLFIAAVGAGLYAAYQKLDAQKKQQLQQDAMDKAAELKDRAVDYAFYASDAVEDLKEVVKDQMDQTKSQIKDWQAQNTTPNVGEEVSSEINEKATQFHEAQERLRSEIAGGVDDLKDEEAQDDIVMTADEALKNQHKDLPKESEVTPKEAKTEEPKTKEAKKD
ncbi:YtxH domain-containing protein [Lentilactobacillus senioris]|uniref:YtxH domain-containing protein n=1 Tax=Lentilactobacillus senioris TaxID=931534 RepID=UPI002280132B|nr:YtxH domain-containing protein [Lentilactobacillus senioris]MCY9807336.1 YtxH domain-containing protein [Lentilactobacillus senioris]